MTGLFYRSQISSEDELKASERERLYSAALDQLNRLHSLCKQGRKYLQSRLKDPELTPETESDIAAWLGHAWQLRELKDAGLVQAGVELLQLAFNSHNDWTRKEFVETGVSALIDEPLWIAELQKLAQADHLNPLLSGYACALLVERNLISNDELAREVSRRLSPGIPADLGAGWFEGLAQRNRYALLTRLALWKELDQYVGSLADDEFKRALVFLRRAFGDFSRQEKHSITENLGEIWGVNVDQVSEALSTELTEKEKKKIDELSDFNFENL